MQLQRFVILTTLVFSVPACGREEAKSVTTLTSDQEASLVEESRQRQAVERAQLEAEPRRTEPTKEARRAGPEPAKGAASERAKTKRVQVTTTAELKMRLEQVDARATDGKSKAELVPTSKRAKFATAIRLYDAKKTQVDKDVADLERVSGEKFAEARTKAEKDLDVLDRFAERIFDNVGPRSESP